MKKLKIKIIVNNFSEVSKAEQDKALKWMKTVKNDLKNLRHDIYKSFNAEYP